MNQIDRLGVWVSMFIGGVVLGVALEAPRWIPEWQPYVDALAVCLVVAAAAAGIASFRAARRRFGQRVAAKWRWLAGLCLAGLMLGVWSFVALIMTFAVSGGPFGARYKKQFHFADLEATVYLYDSSFLDPETTVYVRRGWIPLRERVTTLGKTPDDVEVMLRGNLVIVDDRALDLGSRE